jgi:POT family proton-dependent oligopeptide transporter
MGSTENLNSTSKGHPKGLYVLFVTEMWERFSYYGMRALFVLFMTKALLIDKAVASDIYGSYTGLVYLTPLLGGYMADRYWGNRKSIIIGGIMMALGQFFMFIAGSVYQSNSAPAFMFAGLAFLIIGNGFFKPNISTMVGQLYPEGDQRVDSAFTIFYMGINLGAFIAPLLCGYLGDTGNPADFKWGFLAAGLGMILSLILFITLKNKYIVTPDGQQIGEKANSKRNVSDEPQEKVPFNPNRMLAWIGVFVALFSAFYFYFDLGVIGAFIFGLTIAAPGFIITDPSLDKVEKQRIWVVYIAAFFVIFFWAAFEQAGASLTYFAEEQTDRNLFGSVVPASYFQAINALAIVLFAPIFVWLWGFLGNKGLEPASPYKQSIGLFLLAVGYLVIAFGVNGLDPSAKVSMMWLVSLYTIHTLGELCLSPIGLSMVNKLSPARFASLLMGVWFLSTASANKFAGTLSSLYPEEVKIEKSWDPTLSSSLIESIEKNAIDEAAFNSSPKDEYAFPIATFTTDKLNPSSKNATLQIRNISFDSTSKLGYVSIFHMKLIKGLNKNFNHAVLISENELLTIERNEKKQEDGSFKTEAKAQVWNLKPEKPMFAGFKVETLYDFFMLFVVIAGAASVFLFFLSKRLLVLMNGIR